VHRRHLVALKYLSAQIGATYKFSLGVSNVLMSDYLSEKVPQALFAGGLPVIMGAPNLDALLLGDSKEPVYINALHYAPDELAALLKALAVDQEEYQRFFHWRRRLPDETLPIVQYFRQAKANAFDSDKMMRPMCKMCEHYHQHYDWTGSSPLGFSEDGVPFYGT
jgi:hypothetical protein